MLSARKNMELVAAYERVGTYRGAAAMCGVDPKTAKRKIEAHRSGALNEDRAERAPVPKNTDLVRDVVKTAVREAHGRITAKRLLPVARTAGYRGSGRNFRRLVADVKRAYKAEQGHHQRRPAVWVPGETLVFDWGTLPGGGLHVFCAVLAWCRVRFVRVARDETAATTQAMLAECFEMLGGVPAKALTDRMGCLKGGVVAGVVIPTPDYVRFATHYRFTPDFCRPSDPESKGIVEHLVGYAQRDLVLPDSDDLAVLNEACRAWCDEVNAARHSELCAVPAERLVEEQRLLRPLPMLRARIGRCEIRKVDKLSTVRVASVRYSVPHTLVGATVEVVTFDRNVTIYNTDGDVVARHPQLTAGEASVLDEHYPNPRRAPSRGPRARTEEEKAFLALGEPAEAFITGGAAAGMTMLPKEIIEIVNDILPAHGPEATTKALARAVRFGRFRAADVRSILAIGIAAPEPVPVGQPVVVDLPAVEVRSLDAYRIENLA
jgi:transposase